MANRGSATPEAPATRRRSAGHKVVRLEHEAEDGEIAASKPERTPVVWVQCFRRTTKKRAGLSKKVQVQTGVPETRSKQ